MGMRVSEHFGSFHPTVVSVSTPRCHQQWPSVCCVLLSSPAQWVRSAVDVVVVTKEGTSYLHGYEGTGSDKPAQKTKATGAAKSPSPASNAIQDMDEDDDDDDGGEEDLTSEEDDDSSDDDDDEDDDGDVDDDVVEVMAEGKKAGGKAATCTRGGGGKREGALVARKKRARGGGGGGIARRKKGGPVTGNQRLSDWQVREEGKRA